MYIILILYVLQVFVGIFLNYLPGMESAGAQGERTLSLCRSLWLEGENISVDLLGLSSSQYEILTLH